MVFASQRHLVHTFKSSICGQIDAEDGDATSCAARPAAGHRTRRAASADADRAETTRQVAATTRDQRRAYCIVSDELPTFAREDKIFAGPTKVTRRVTTTRCQ